MKAPHIAHTWLKLDTGGHTETLVALATTPDGGTVVSAGDCTLRVWDAATRGLRRQILGHTAPQEDGGHFTGSIDAMVLSPDGRWVLSVKSRRRVEIFELSTGNLHAAFDHGQPADSLNALAFSPDGRWLALGVTRAQGTAHRRAVVQLLATQSWLRAGFDRPPAPLAEHLVARTGKLGDLMHLSIQVQWLPEAVGAGQIVAAVDSQTAAGQDAVHWLQWDAVRGLRRRHVHRFDVPLHASTLAVGEAGLVVAVDTGAVGRGDGGPLGCLLALGHQGQPLGHPLYVEQRPVAACFSANGRQLAVGLRSAGRRAGEQVALAHVLQLSAAGLEPRSTYYGHDGDVAAMAWRGEDEVVSAGGDNHAIHLWRPDARVARTAGVLRGVGQGLWSALVDADEQLRFGTVPPRLRPPNHAARQQCFDLRALALQTRSPSEPRRGEMHSRRWLIGGPGGGDGNGDGAHVLQLHYRPQSDAFEVEMGLTGHLTLFVGADDQWVLWTRSGFYATNAPSNRRFGYCVDRGPHQEALFLRADRFPVFDRADIVRAVVEHGSEALARQAGVDIPQVDVASLLPPWVEVVRARPGADLRTVEIEFTATPLYRGGPTTRIWVLRNERFVWFEDDPQVLKRRRFKLTLPLNPGRNVFKLCAQCAWAKAEPCVLDVQGAPALPADVRHEAAKGRLFLLAVGVSNFKIAGTPAARGTEPLRYPRRDASAVVRALSGHNAAFESVQSALLLDEQATKPAILAQVRQFADAIVRREMQPGAERDVLLVYLSGHGTRFTGEAEFYFWNWELVPTRDEMERTGLSLVEFAEIATAVPAEVVLIIDACHSGMSGSNMMQSLDPQELARRIQAIHERGMYVINASSADQVSFESQQLRHGLFTRALLQALRTPRFASGPRGAVSMLSLMSAVQSLVPRLAQQLGGRQMPVCRLYGDLLPLTIYQRPRGRSAKPALRTVGPSAKVASPQGDTSKPSGEAIMATAKKAPAKKAIAKKVAAKKVAARKAAPAKKAATGLVRKPGVEATR
jgi:uncharacterized caspase-like protein